LVKIEVTISDTLYSRLKKISELLDIEFDRILQLSLVDGGYYKYWGNIEKFIEDTSTILDSEDSTENIYTIKSDLKRQFNERSDIVSDINSLEQDFRNKFRHFKTDIEQHRAFLDFIDLLHSRQLIDSEEELLDDKVITEVQKTQEIDKEVAEEVPTSHKVERSYIKLLPRKYVPMLVLIAISDFLIIKLFQIFWSSFTFIQILQYNPVQLFPYFMIIIFASLLTGVLYRHYYNKFKASIPVRRESKEVRHFIRNFDSRNPRAYSRDPIVQIHNDIKRLQKLEREFRIKRKK
jgi:hypothetical protein